MTKKAAAVLLVSAMLFLVPASCSKPAVPMYDGAHFSASEVAHMAGMDPEMKEDGTRSYTKVAVAGEKDLDIRPLPETEYVTVYQPDDRNHSVSKSELNAFSDRLYGGICEALGVEKQELKINERAYADEGKVIDSSAECGNYWITFSQSEKAQTSSIGSRNPDGVISLYGTEISVDQRQSDEEIVSSLQDLNKQLCGLFKADLPDIKIIRKYDDYSENGVTWLTVYFYNGESIPDGSMASASDRIELVFDNFANYADDVVSGGILSKVSVYYFHYLSALEPVATVRLLPLEEAEKLLYSGCVFGMHVCPLCMAEQPEVDFHGYDLVDVRYVNGVPFYAFFNKLDLPARNGNLTYAKTFVPAFEVSGLQEYFESQKSSHGS